VGRDPLRRLKGERELRNEERERGRGGGGEGGREREIGKKEEREGLREGWRKRKRRGELWILF
jgi:hypothetical protein